MTTAVDDATTPPVRLLPMEGCVNFRDLGGYRTAGGQQTRWRTLFRADGLSSLSTADCGLLSDLGLATVIDLRSPFEAEHRGRFPVDQVPVRYFDLPLMDVRSVNFGDVDLSGWTETSYVSDQYFAMVVDGGAALTRAITALAEPDALPAVVHCSAGKDRTGVLSALILAFLGVPDDTIAADYALSGEAMDGLVARFKADYPGLELDRLLPAVLHAAPESMAGFLGKVRDVYGTYEGLAAALGVADAVDVLRGALLEAV